MINKDKTEALIRELRAHLGIQADEVLELNCSHTHYTLKKYGRFTRYRVVENICVAQEFDKVAS
ncbi:hypothetical protein AHIS2_p028 [Acaryochloris phage A-HIS2]|nr:hypothetical protein AHIS2_p028 [Acaryochloris phage A-HIS2]